jgi:23S rRNA pseudouridine2605 synthase
MPRKPAPRQPGKPSNFRPRKGGGPPRGAVRPRPKPAVAASARDDSPADNASPREGERLQKVLAAAGLASRRECEELITEGRVEIDGEVVTELGVRVDRATQEIKVDGEPLARPKLVYYAINKPTGVVTTARDPAGRPRVIDLLPPGVGRVFPVGRLDLASEGLILLTNDGDLANQLTHPKHGVEKTYEVQVAGHMEPDVLTQLRRGVYLSEGFAHAVHARIKAKLKRSTLLEMVLDEGRNREVRRLLARVGHKVQRLTRVAVGPIRLGDMPRGAFRKLSQEEVRKLREAAAAGPKLNRDSTAPSGGTMRPRPVGKKPPLRKPPVRSTVAGKTPAGRPPGRKPPSHKPPLRKPPAGKPAIEAQEFQRKIVGGGDSAEGEAGTRKPPTRKPPAGKPRFRKPTTGTKLTGRKPVKRRRPERPQRGSNKS